VVELVDWAQQQIKSRLQHCGVGKQNLANMCADFRVPVLQTTKKRELIQALAENMMMWTDDEEDQEEDEQ
jgi:hypothetical protein